MKPIKPLPKITSRTAKDLKEKTNDQSRIRTDHTYQKMIHRVLYDVFPDY